MNKFPLYPDAPHLSASVYVDHMQDSQVFTAWCRVLRAHEGTETGIIEVVPAALEFEAVSDLADQIRHVQPGQVGLRRMLDGDADETRVVRAGFSVPPVGLAVVTYEPGEPDHHPIAVLAHAGSLGLPEFVWEEADKEKAAAEASWVRGIFRDACRQMDPLYGSISVETTLSTPAKLRAGATADTDMFVSSRLLAVDSGLEGALRKCWSGGCVAEWESGTFFSGWSLLNQAGSGVADRSLIDDHAGRLIAHAIDVLRS